MASTTRRTFIAGTALALAGALGAGLRAASPAAADEEPYLGFDRSFELGGARFYFPGRWTTKGTAAAGVEEELQVVAEYSGRTVGTLVFRCERDLPVSALYADVEEFFDDLVAEQAVDETGLRVRVWGREEHDRGGVAMAKAAAMRMEAADLKIGHFYMAFTPEDDLVTMMALVDADDYPDFAADIDRVWYLADWGVSTTSPEPSADGEAGSEERSTTEDEHLLEKAIADNERDPFFNPYWTVVDVDARPGGGPNDVRYLMESAWGFQCWSDELVTQSTGRGAGAPGTIEHYCMPCTDSSGGAYLRTSASIDGYGGVCDVVFYPGYSDVWYVATDGTPVYTDARGDWVIYDATSGAEWEPVYLGAN